MGTKKAVELLKQLPEIEKAKYQKIYDDEMQKYNAWKKSDAGQAMMSEKKEAAKEKKNDKANRLEKNEAKAAQKAAKADAGCPKKPMTPCFAYTAENRVKIGEMPDVEGKGLG